MLYFILAWAGVSGYLAFSSRNILLRLGAAIPWLALLIYITTNYPDEPWSTFGILGAISMSIAIPLALFERTIDYTPSKRRTNLYNEPAGGRLEAAENESPTGTLRRAFNTFSGNPNPPRPKRGGESPEDYKARVHGVLGRDRRRRRLDR